MPGLSGFDVLKRLRDHPECKVLSSPTNSGLDAKHQRPRQAEAVRDVIAGNWSVKQQR